MRSAPSRRIIRVEIAVAHACIASAANSLGCEPLGKRHRAPSESCTPVATRAASACRNTARCQHADAGLANSRAAHVSAATPPWMRHSAGRSGPRSGDERWKRSRRARRRRAAAAPHGGRHQPHHVERAIRLMRMTRSNRERIGRRGDDALAGRCRAVDQDARRPWSAAAFCTRLGAALSETCSDCVPLMSIATRAPLALSRTRHLGAARQRARAGGARPEAPPVTMRCVL